MQFIIATLLMLGACQMSPQLIQDAEVIGQDVAKTVMDAEGIPQPPIIVKTAPATK